MVRPRQQPSGPPFASPCASGGSSASEVGEDEKVCSSGPASLVAPDCCSSNGLGALNCIPVYSAESRSNGASGSTGSSVSFCWSGFQGSFDSAPLPGTG